MTAEDFDATVGGGLSPAGMLELLEAHRISVSELEGVGAWQRGGSAGEESRRSEERLYELADLFGSARLNIGVIDEDGPATAPDDLVERFAAVCDRAREHGVVVGLEPLVLGWLRTPGQAAEIVTAAARPNGGVLLDSYHLFRAQAPLEEALAQILPEQIVAVQINDALIEPRGSVFEDCCSYRLVPGEGEQPLVEFLGALDRMGVDAPIAVELMAADLRPLPVHEAARRVASATRSVLAEARAATV